MIEQTKIESYQTSKCDVCGKVTENLSDFFCLICNECKKTHKDLNELRKIGLKQELKIK